MIEHPQEPLFPNGPMVKIIYNAGHIWPLGIVQSGEYQGWIVGKHPDGQWVTLVRPQTIVTAMPV